MNKELKQKYGKLKESIKKLGSAIVAFSGGIDSALVLKVAYDALGEKAIAVTADSPSLPRRELEETKRIASGLGFDTNGQSISETLRVPSQCWWR